MVEKNAHLIYILGKFVVKKEVDIDFSSMLQSGYRIIVLDCYRRGKMATRQQKIFELCRQLESLGYYSYQVDNIIKDFTNTTDIGSLTDQQVNELISELEGYIKFARTCREKKI